MDEQTSKDQTERLIRLEEKHHSTYKLTCQIADNADTTAKALQELVLIHKETRLRSEADRVNIGHIESRMEGIDQKHERLYKTVWRGIYTGAGGASILGILWYTGLLNALIRSNEVLEPVNAMAL